MCLGCGCACDDIHLTTRDGRIVHARNACELGVAWFGDGSVPQTIRVGGRDASLNEAIENAATLLTGARSPLIYLAPDLTCEAQRQGVALADRLRATLDSVTSATSMPFLLAAQERGRAGATLGEIRHRADVLVFWGTDPAATHPRFSARYAPDSGGLHLANGSRTIVAVDVGAWKGPTQVDVRETIQPDEEVATLTWLSAAAACGFADDDAPSQAAAVAALSPVLRAARYVALVADAEETEPGRDPGRARALVALAQALNGPTRGAAILLRAGGNRSGADAVMTSQTGFPAAVDFARGYPRYRPVDGAAGVRLAARTADAALVLGSPSLLPSAVLEGLKGIPCVVVGSRASQSPLASARIVVDTGIGGIHHGGTALRMDDVPLPLRAVLGGPESPEDVMRALRSRVGLRPGGAS